MRAFFFADGEFVGNDDASTSTNVRVAKARQGAVTLTYGVERPAAATKVALRALRGRHAHADGPGPAASTLALTA